MESGSAVFLRDQRSGCTMFVGSGPKFVTLLESRIRKLGTEMGLVRRPTCNCIRSVGPVGVVFDKSNQQVSALQDNSENLSGKPARPLSKPRRI